MPSWSDLIDSINSNIQKDPDFIHKIRFKYLENIHRITGRNVIAYYSSWLKSPEAPNLIINESDKNAFMNAVYSMDRTIGLDLILHTPGGDIAATESIVNYLTDIFNGNIRAIVPQISMSAGTMIAIACKEIIMGRQSSLGPIDPQMGGVACQAVLDEFQQAVKEVSSNPAALGLWQVIISKYHPTFLTECHDSVVWSEKLAEQWLKKVNPSIDINKFKQIFINHKESYSHSRHFSKEVCRKAGLNIIDLESNQELQEAVLSLHHCYMILTDSSPISKIVENHIKKCYLQTARKIKE